MFLASYDIKHLEIGYKLKVIQWKSWVVFYLELGKLTSNFVWKNKQTKITLETWEHYYILER